jgi:hypothetical protein
MKADAFDRFIGLRHLWPASRRAGSTASFFLFFLRCVQVSRGHTGPEGGEPELHGGVPGTWAKKMVDAKVKMISSFCDCAVRICTWTIFLSLCICGCFKVRPNHRAPGYCSKALYIRLGWNPPIGRLISGQMSHKLIRISYSAPYPAGRPCQSQVSSGPWAHNTE